jgi:hypothetical protein
VLTHSGTTSPKCSLVTVAIAAISLFFSAPAVIVAVFYRIPPSILGRLPGGLWFENFVSLCWIGVAIGGRVYLLLSCALNFFLLFRRQTPTWLRVLLWALFLVAVLGLWGVETELSHVRH